MVVMNSLLKQQSLKTAALASVVMLGAASMSAMAQQQAAPPPAATVSQPTLPGGASSVREAHEDWAVTCQMQAKDEKSSVKVCSFMQEQLDARTRQRVLAVELVPGKAAGVTKATFVLPFGLDLQKDITMQIDDGATIATQRVRTCLPAGCVLDVDLTSATLASLGKGKLLKVNAVADGGKATPFSISLKGFQSAYSRTVELAK
jgi:invasion protein IalB